MNINESAHGLGFALPFTKQNAIRAALSERTGSLKSNRIPYLGWVPDDARNHFVATSAEYVGTTLFLFFAFSGTQVALLASPAGESVVGAPSNPAQLLYIALSFGFSLAVNAWVFFRISGGLFNPAVTMGMCLVGALPYMRGLFLFIAQILGGITAAGICSALFPGPLNVRTNLGGGTTVAQGLFIEMFLTAELVFTIFMLAAEKHKGTFIAPIGIGLSLFIAELTGVYFTGGSVNPARSFGPSVMSRQFHSYHWIYWLGPVFGSLLASGFYKFIKMLEYETANPGQDRAKPQGEYFDPTTKIINGQRVNFTDDVADQLAIAMEEGAIGSPREYGAAARPYSTSPAPPHPNDMHVGIREDVYIKADNFPHNHPSHRRPVSSEVSPAFERQHRRQASNEVSAPILRELEHLRREHAAQQIPRKPAMKPISQESMTGGQERERSARHNTKVNKLADAGVEREDFYCEKF